MCLDFQDTLGRERFAGESRLFYSNSQAKAAAITEEKTISQIYKGEMQTD